MSAWPKKNMQRDLVLGDKTPQFAIGGNKALVVYSHRFLIGYMEDNVLKAGRCELKPADIGRLVLTMTSRLGDIADDVDFTAFLDPARQKEKKGFALALLHQAQEDSVHKLHVRKMQYFENDQRWGTTRSGIALHKSELREFVQVLLDGYLVSLRLAKPQDRAFMLGMSDQIAFHKHVSHVHDVDDVAVAHYDDGKMQQAYLRCYAEAKEIMTKEEAKLFLRRHVDHVRDLAYLRILEGKMDCLAEDELLGEVGAGEGKKSAADKRKLPALGFPSCSEEEADEGWKKKAKKGGRAGKGKKKSSLRGGGGDNDDYADDVGDDEDDRESESLPHGQRLI